MAGQQPKSGKPTDRETTRRPPDPSVGQPSDGVEKIIKETGRGEEPITSKPNK